MAIIDLFLATKHCMTIKYMNDNTDIPVKIKKSAEKQSLASQKNRK